MSEIEHNPESEQNVFEFALYLEKIAEKYDPGYKEGEESFVRFAKSSADYFDLSSNSYSFSAERVIADSSDEILLTIYKVIGETKFDGLNRNSFPDDVWEALQYGETELVDGESIPTKAWIEQLSDPETRFSIGCDHTITVTSDGMMEDLTQVYAYVNDSPIELPDSRIKPSTVVPQPQPLMSEIAEVLAEDEQVDILQVVSADDVELFRCLGQAVIKELELTLVVDTLYLNIERNLFKTAIGTMNSGKNILRSLFPESEKIETE